MTSTRPLSDLTVPAMPGPELAELVAALRRRAELPGVLIHIDPDLDTNAEASGSPCSRAARIDLGADLLREPASQALYGTLAHEIAHHALDHGQATVAGRFVVWLAKAALLVALATRLPLGVLTVLACGVLLTHLVAARRSRLQEYDADTHAMRLLDAVGLPGRRLVAAALADLYPETLPYRLGGWLFGEHPTPRARRRTLASGRPAPRLRWALLWQRTSALTTTPTASRSARAAGSAHRKETAR